MKKLSLVVVLLASGWAQTGAALVNFTGIAFEPAALGLCTPPLSLYYCNAIPKPTTPTPAQPTAPAPQPATPSAATSGSPSATLRATASTVNSGQTTQLSWSSQSADRCVASGAWSGTLPASGTRVVGPLSRSSTFTLTCSGGGGSAIAMTSVSVLGQLQVRWKAPTKNADGTPLTDLAGYRIYYGQSSGHYDGVQDIRNPAATTGQLRLPTGSYYVAATALDRDGNESRHSNEVVKTVQ